MSGRRAWVLGVAGLGSGLLLVGPVPATPGPVRSIGPEGYVARAELRDLRYPDPAQAAEVLALTSFALWRSGDGGASWREMTATLPEIGRFRGVEVDPFDPLHWLLWSGPGPQSSRDTLAETRDGGASWTSRGLPGSELLTLRFDPGLKDLLLAADGYRLWRSRDAGLTWEPFTPPPLDCCAFPRIRFYQPRQGRFLAAVEDDLWSLALGSGEWRKISDQDHKFDQVVVDRANPDVFYGVRFGRLFKSADGGANWVAVLADDRGLTSLVQSPLHPGHLAAVGYELLRSTDGGASWVAEPVHPPGSERTAIVFGPAGDLLLPDDHQLLRVLPDGARSHFRPRGLYALPAQDFHLDPGGDYFLSSDDLLLRQEPDGRWTWIGKSDCGGLAQRLAFEPGNTGRVFVSCSGSYQVSTDGGGSFSERRIFPTGDPVRFVFGPGEPPPIFLLREGTSLETFEGPLASIANAVDAVADPDPDLGLLVSTVEVVTEPVFSRHGYLYRWRPRRSTQLLKDWGELDPFRLLAQDPQDPEHLLAIGSFSGTTSESSDRGATWAPRGQRPLLNGPVASQLIFDPNDGEHLVAGGAGTWATETRDGGASWQWAAELHDTHSVKFDAASTLYAGSSDGLLARAAATQLCADGTANFCARQDRFELTVEWKTPNGATGVAKKVETGSQESGLFYFFDADNWELLVKVLDGCGINQRFWVFTAGTTDVEYALKVEDRWTGRIRTYWNAPGQAAPATTDIDAFATCGEPAPAGAAAAPPVLTAADAMAEGGGALQLVGGRFEVTANYTDFAGHTGAATPAPLLSPNSGLFWFFSPDNWEVLIKVLDGCAINGHYWVLAAATTDVGYELRVAEPSRQREKLYRNPVGRAAPAQIDLEAFSCR